MKEKKKTGKNREWKTLLFEIFGLASGIVLLIIGCPMIISLIRGMAKDGVTATGILNTAVLSVMVYGSIYAVIAGIRAITYRIYLKREERAEKKKKTLI